MINGQGAFKTLGPVQKLCYYVPVLLSYYLGPDFSEYGEKSLKIELPFVRDVLAICQPPDHNVVRIELSKELVSQTTSRLKRPLLAS